MNRNASWQSKPHLERAFHRLSGDHNQLGPVVMSRNTPGLTISLMERLMTCDPLYNGEKTGSSDQTTSDLFYEGELIARALPCLAITPGEGENGLSLSICLHRRSGNCQSTMEMYLLIQPNGTGLSNSLPQLHQMSFGVISPYRAQYMQCENAMDFCPRLEFGSPELFKGKKRTSFSIGFLDNFRRFNVAITRARYLCIVIGDASLLQKDPTWLALIHYTKENGGFISSKDTQTIDVNALTEQLKKIQVCDN
ncbi:DNA-binding protein smubp-2 [Caligus rogercresseyi]|uniref:DNA-binding protein smubp-2 n=1 Tax=Caligus rogercresseyi TaxID=217165 RepID=A0A7T8QUQ7_CALRO|nr:DNA-binding protein smubp-2 [Caligus rogercresseyi]